ncbi:MAG TPA: SDR family NAD(P)-dependent oxidoreductase [Candidatus Udaeobacter sp.]|nr:SDR family NAD(P)-dependent oxidoreductase [Candidatus Udaeobacter sp.]
MNQKVDDRKKLNGKIAIITGATGGIGEATVKLFLREGANVMLVDRSSDKLRAARDRLALNKRVAWSVADAADEEATAAAVAATIKTFGGVDILFANAGTEGWVKPIETVDVTEFEQVLRTNVLGVWLAMKHCVEPMKKRGQGSMIATASIAGLIGYPGLAPYSASKHAVCGLVETAALELGACGLRVNAIAPGPIDNRMMGSVESQASPQDPAAVRDAVRARIAMGRYGINEEVANLAAFLASDESSYCTGGIYTIDGGYTAA